MEKFPKITIITPTYNAEKDIESCILSVANQTYDNKEHLIMDGLSTDNTLEIVNKFAKKYPHIKIISEKDNGIYDAMNKGIDKSSGEWIHFLGSDDLFYNNDVLKDIFTDQNILSFDIVYGNVMWGDTGKIYDGEFTPLKLLEKNICHQAIFTKKALFDRIGKFNLKYKILSDKEFNYRWFSDNSVKRKFIDIVVAKFGILGKSLTVYDVDFYHDRKKLIETYFDEAYVELDKKIQENKALKNLLKDREEEISYLRSSKFWKIRNKYLEMKGLFSVKRNYITSIIIVSHNYGKYIEQCINSALNQTVKPKEIIVIDDASEDNTEEVVSKFSKAVKYFRVNFKNAQKTRNFGLSKATGKYIVFFDADDYFREDFLEKMQKPMERNRWLAMAYSDRINTGNEELLKSIGQRRSWKSQSFNYEDLKRYNYISIPAIIRRNIFTGFDERINRFQDWEAWLTFLKNKKAVHVAEPLFYVRFHSANKTFKPNKYLERLKVLYKHNVLNLNKANSETSQSNLELPFFGKNIVAVTVYENEKLESIIKLAESITNIGKNNKTIFYLVEQQKIPNKLTEVLANNNIAYRIIRNYNLDKALDFVKFNEIVPLHACDNFIFFNSRNIDPLNQNGFSNSVYKSEKDIFSLGRLEEINYLIFDQKDTRIFFNC